MKRNYLALTLIFLCLASCDTARSKLDKSPFEMLAMAGLNLETKYIVIIPQNGCPSCIKKTYSFIMNHSESRKISYVFTHFATKKEIRIYLNSMGVVNQDNFYFLDKSLGDEFGLSMMYPTLLEKTESGKNKITLMNSEDYSDWTLLEDNI
ncbi:hypothetical protein [Roseivirga sp.]|uniref:hypothetical protein n=1 Tax=Roseivirga sp. TaxID=1964215 RepID=UPI003B8BC8D2